MGLVGYSDSEDSDGEQATPASKQATVAKPSTKPAFQKLVDKANPGKIRVGLPTSTAAAGQKDGEDIDGPPAKRAKTGGGFSGFNAMLPAPKKVAQAATTGSSAPRRSLGVGVNLKTSGQAAFSRDPVEVAAEYDEYGSATSTGYGEPRNGATSTESKEPEVKLIGKATVFRPLSVGNKKGKRKVTAAEIQAAKAGAASSGIATIHKPVASVAKPAVVPAPAPAKPKVSLFSLDAKDEPPAPLAPDPIEDDDNDEAEEDYWPGTTISQPPSISTNGASGAPNHDATADLNLTPAERRQLFGRAGKGDLSAINIVNFNTDEEYARNEALRASGEAEAAAQQNRGVRSIAPGKHSLKQLVNAAVGQKDALEDSFAQGKKNKKEAGNKYGW